MREIKFRAWDEQKKIMHYDFQYIKNGDTGNDWIIFTSDKHPLSHTPHPFQDPYFAQQLKIMEWTGLKDGFGQDLYEEDIINYDGDKQYIRWNGCAKKFGATFIRDGEVYNIPNNFAIIGNRYENPELTGE